MGSVCAMEAAFALDIIIHILFLVADVNSKGAGSALFKGFLFGYLL